jgi:hypothetical protein
LYQAVRLSEEAIDRSMSCPKAAVWYLEVSRNTSVSLSVVGGLIYYGANMTEQAHRVVFLVPCLLQHSQDRFDKVFTVSDQLRKQVPFHVERAYLIRLPSGKGPENGAPPAIPTNIDHFECYHPQRG